MSSRLVEVIDNRRPSAASRVQALQAQARSLAAEHVETFVTDMLALEIVALQIAGGGDAYPIGVRELCGRIASDLEGSAKTITALAGRRP